MIIGQQPIVFYRADHGERLEIPRNRKGSEFIRRDGTLMPAGGIFHRRAEVAQTAEVAETA